VKQRVERIAADRHQGQHTDALAHSFAWGQCMALQEAAHWRKTEEPPMLGSITAMLPTTRGGGTVSSLDGNGGNDCDAAR
jgi:hypothetical protein